MSNDEFVNSTTEAMATFFSEEINMANSTAEFYLQWLIDNASYKLTSGNSFFLEKNGEDTVIIGNLFDQSFTETEVSKQELINYINSKIGY